MKTLAVIGSRKYATTTNILEDLEDLLADGAQDPFAVLTDGGPVGAVAAKWAAGRGLPAIHVHPVWRKRRSEIAAHEGLQDGGAELDYLIAIADSVIVYWDGKSKNALKVAELAKKAGKLGALHIGLPQLSMELNT